MSRHQSLGPKLLGITQIFRLLASQRDHRWPRPRRHHRPAPAAWPLSQRLRDPSSRACSRNARPAAGWLPDFWRSGKWTRLRCSATASRPADAGSSLGSGLGQRAEHFQLSRTQPQGRAMANKLHAASLLAMVCQETAPLSVVLQCCFGNRSTRYPCPETEQCLRSREPKGGRGRGHRLVQPDLPQPCRAGRAKRELSHGSLECQFWSFSLCSR